MVNCNYNCIKETKNSTIIDVDKMNNNAVTGGLKILLDKDIFNIDELTVDDINTIITRYMSNKIAWVGIRIYRKGVNKTIHKMNCDGCKYTDLCKLSGEAKVICKANDTVMVPDGTVSDYNTILGYTPDQIAKKQGIKNLKK